MPAPIAKIRESEAGLTLAAITSNEVPPIVSVEFVIAARVIVGLSSVPSRFSPTPRPTPALPPKAIPPPMAMIRELSDALTATLPPVVATTRAR